ncbi:hypothetical protein M0R45_021105 [Rubus argutus]|uniref:BRWD/PHIP N-terminal domain-containing protein n=1 Tax=Rubus argutus TaxID=59490 RepID=A0AAW1XCJ6_RUBAR
MNHSTGFYRSYGSSIKFPCGDAPSVSMKPLSFLSKLDHVRELVYSFWNELLEHQLLTRRYHAWYSGQACLVGMKMMMGKSFPLNYNMLVPSIVIVQSERLLAFGLWCSEAE